MKKFLTLAFVAILAFSLVACTGGGSTTTTEGAVKVGIAMPTQSLQRWNEDGDNLKKEFESAGYVVDLQYGGDNDVPTQVGQVENMISGGCTVLIIAAIDGSSLTEALAPAGDDITVIAYDRLIRDTPNVDYYASFDNYKVGKAQGDFIVEALKLADDSVKGPFNVEIFTGDFADNNAKFFYQGGYDALKPYIESGKVVILSGQSTQEQTATEGWDTGKAQARMENLVSAHKYGPKGTKLDAVLCSNDSTAYGVITALTGAGYTAADIPVITGQDCDKGNLSYLLQGLQKMSVFKDTRALAKQTIEMVKAVAAGETPATNNTTDYDNGVKAVPSYLLEPIPTVATDIQALLFDSDYYSWDDAALSDAAKYKDNASPAAAA